MTYNNRIDINLPDGSRLNLTSTARIIKLKNMILEKERMEFSNLDRACLNLLAYQWTRVGPPGTLAVDQITGCFGDIPKAYVHKALAVLNEKGYILLEPLGRSASLTGKGFDHIRDEVAEPVCTNPCSYPPFI